MKKSDGHLTFYITQEIARLDATWVKPARDARLLAVHMLIGQARGRVSMSWANLSGADLRGVYYS